VEVQEILDHLKEQLHCHTDAELAKKLNVQPATLSGWKTRNAVGTLLGELAQKRIPVSIDQILHQSVNGTIGNQTIALNSAQIKAQSELDRQIDIAKRLIADAIDKENELIALLKDFNKRMI
jgi:uncharacterized protein YjcR